MPAAKFSQCPLVKHVKAAKHILRYVKLTINKGLYYPRGTETSTDDLGKYLDAWHDASFMDAGERRSTCGYVIRFASMPISWASKIIANTCLSTMEAEICASAECMRELMYLYHVCKFLSGTDFTEKKMMWYTFG